MTTKSYTYILYILSVSKTQYLPIFKNLILFTFFTFIIIFFYQCYHKNFLYFWSNIIAYLSRTEIDKKNNTFLSKNI